MRFVADQMVPDSLCRFLVDRKHDVRLVREELFPKAPDLLISKTAHMLGAIVITWNVKDFRRDLCGAPRGENIRFRHAGMIGMKCPESHGLRLCKISGTITVEA